VRFAQLRMLVSGLGLAMGAAQLSAQVSPTEYAQRRAALAGKIQDGVLLAIGSKEPATLNDVATALGRGAPAVSRSVDALVRAGLVERMQDPHNRRRLALRLTQAGRERLSARIAGGAALRNKLERLAQSELRALERAIEILERG